MGNRSGWEGVSVAGQLEERIGLSVYVENDVVAATLAREWFSPRDYRGRVLYILVFEGIGVTLTNKDIMPGVGTDCIIELGHMVMEVNGVMDDKFYSKCLERLASDIAFINCIWPDKKRSARFTKRSRS